jgi:hypothetical protein
MRWYELCNAKSSAALFSLKPFKPLSPETIKAQRTNPADAGFNTQTLSQCNRVNPNARAANPRGDEREMKL